MFVQILQPQNVPALRAIGIPHVLAVNDVKWNLLAKSLLFPGFTTLICDMLRSTTDLSEEHKEILPDWRIDYADGQVNSFAHALG